MTMTAPEVFVFAYGSNLHARRMLIRTPSAIPVATGYVNSRQLVFHKRSEDGSAKADAAFTAVTTDRVWGVVYRIRADEKPVLDRYEFLGVGYDQERVTVTLDKGLMQAFIYVARREAIDSGLLPYSWYLDYVIRGAVQHRLPDSHIALLMRTESLPDPNRARHAKHRRIIDGCSPR